MVVITTKRIYEKPEASDGYRILIDRLWPRGLSKEKAQVDYWAKSIAPSHQLRKWFNHEPSKWIQFLDRYQSELAHNDDWRAFRQLVEANEIVCLVFASREEKVNNAQAIAHFLKQDPRQSDKVLQPGRP